MHTCLYIVTVFYVLYVVCVVCNLVIPVFFASWFILRQLPWQPSRVAIGDHGLVWRVDGDDFSSFLDTILLFEWCAFRVCFQEN